MFARTGGDGPRGISAFYVKLDEAHVDRKIMNDFGNCAPITEIQELTAGRWLLEHYAI